jgi:FkbM family methyltransferase
MSEFTGKLNHQFRKLGFQIKKYKKPNNKWLTDAGIKSIIDVGANVGQFALHLASILPQAKIYSFEPIPSCFEGLKENTRKLNIELFNCALGEGESEEEMNVHEHTPSSSLLAMQDLHEKAYPNSIKSVKEKIIVRKLDNVFADINLEPNLLIKIDVQGFEEKVILGGMKTINQAKIIIIELTYDCLYQHQPFFDDIYTYLKGMGFTFKGNISQDLNPETGLILFSDSVFVKD